MCLGLGDAIAQQAHILMGTVALIGSNGADTGHRIDVCVSLDHQIAGIADVLGALSIPVLSLGDLGDVVRLGTGSGAGCRNFCNVLQSQLEVTYIAAVIAVGIHMGAGVNYLVAVLAAADVVVTLVDPCTGLAIRIAGGDRSLDFLGEGVIAEHSAAGCVVVVSLLALGSAGCFHSRHVLVAVGMQQCTADSSVSFCQITSAIAVGILMTEIVLIVASILGEFTVGLLYLVHLDTSHIVQISARLVDHQLVAGSLDGHIGNGNQLAICVLEGSTTLIAAVMGNVAIFGTGVHLCLNQTDVIRFRNVREHIATHTLALAVAEGIRTSHGFALSVTDRAVERMGTILIVHDLVIDMFSDFISAFAAISLAMMAVDACVRRPDIFPIMAQSLDHSLFLGNDLAAGQEVLMAVVALCVSNIAVFLTGSRLCIRVGAAGIRPVMEHGATAEIAGAVMVAIDAVLRDGSSLTSSADFALPNMGGLVALDIRRSVDELTRLADRSGIMSSTHAASRNMLVHTVFRHNDAVVMQQSVTLIASAILIDIHMLQCFLVATPLAGNGMGTIAIVLVLELMVYTGFDYVAAVLAFNAMGLAVAVVHINAIVHALCTGDRYFANRANFLVASFGLNPVAGSVLCLVLRRSTAIVCTLLPMVGRIMLRFPLVARGGN